LEENIGISKNNTTSLWNFCHGMSTGTSVVNLV